MQSPKPPSHRRRIALVLISLMAAAFAGCPSIPGTDGDGSTPDGDGSGQPLPCENVVLDVEINGEGDVDQSSECAQVTLSAIPVDGWQFDGWFGSTSSKTNPITIIATDDTNIGARFLPIPADSDGDGIPDAADACSGFDDNLDSDRDGVPDGCDVCPGGDDADDADFDGDPDSCDACPNDNPNDTDNDGVCESSDVCPGFNDHADADEDGEPDGCDDCPNDAENDSDRDGVCGDVDECPGTPLGTVVDEEGCPRCGNEVLDGGEECDPPEAGVCDDNCFFIRPDNNDCIDAIAVGDGLQTFSNERATTDGPAESGECGPMGADVWYCYTAPCDGRVTIDLCDSEFDTVLSVYSGCNCPPAAADRVACDDDTVGCGTSGNRSTVTFETDSGQTYLVRVGGFNAVEGSGVVSFFCDASCLSAADCADGNLCTDDVCNTDGTCSNPFNNASCDDGIFCNGADFCQNGTCSGHDGDPCTDGPECANLCNEPQDTCNRPAGTECSDEGNVCTDNECDGQGNCVGIPNTVACDDGLFCNGEDTCDGGTCSSHAGDPCASGAECQDMCDEDANDCLSPAGTPCDDDGNVCTDNECDGFGECVAMFNSAPCDDGEFCNGDDTCDQGACSIHTGDPCSGATPFCEEGAEGPICNECRTPFDCDDDGISCTGRGCDDGVCVHIPFDGDCDDFDLCTTDICDVETGCRNEPVTCPLGMVCDPDTGQCVPIPCTTPEECADGDPCTDDDCVDDVCVITVRDCDDGNFCNGQEFCEPSVGCQDGIPVDCADGIGCTVDTCDEANDECVNAASDALCEDGQFCNGAAACDPVMDCVSLGLPCPPRTMCNEADDVCEGVATNWQSTQLLFPGMDPPGFSPLELYELDASGALIVAHLGLTQAELEEVFGDDYAEVTVLTTDVVPGGPTLLYRLFRDFGGGNTETVEQEITINTFQLDVSKQGAEFVAVWTFDYILGRIVNGLFGVEQDVTQYTGSQRAMIFPDGLTIMWDSLEGTERLFLEQCDDGGESATCDVDCTFARCGDGVFNFTAGEFCEDGNTTPGDGCDGNCQLEGGFLPPPPPPTPPPTCGDGVIDGFDPVPLTEQTFQLGTWTVQDGP